MWFSVDCMWVCVCLWTYDWIHRMREMEIFGESERWTELKHDLCVVNQTLKVFIPISIQYSCSTKPPPTNSHTRQTCCSRQVNDNHSSKTNWKLSTALASNAEVHVEGKEAFATGAMNSIVCCTSTSTHTRHRRVWMCKCWPFHYASSFAYENCLWRWWSLRALKSLALCT